MWMGSFEMAIDAYRVWLLTKLDLAEDAIFMYTKEHPAEIPRERATHHARGLREALEAFNNIFEAGEESLEEKVLAVAERIDVDPEELEQDIADAVKAVRTDQSGRK